MRPITLDNSTFEGENRAYLFDGPETVLVDTGIAVDETRAQLVDGLAAAGVSFEDVDAVFLTHFHGDHSGLVGEIQRVSGATVYAHPDDAPIVEGDEAAWDALRDRQRTRFVEWGMPRDKREQLVARLDASPTYYGEDATVEPFEAGDRFDVGETELEVLHTPGHTAGLCSFVMTDRNEILTGDALLPVYTPNVGGADVRLDRSLAKYVDTLETLADREFDRAWPGHRDPIDDPTGRALEILHHHEQRALRVLRVLQTDGPADPWTVSAALFGELAGIHVLHGPGEAYAHLEHLTDAGEVRYDGETYRLTAETRARLENYEADGWPL